MRVECQKQARSVGSPAKSKSPQYCARLDLFSRSPRSERQHLLPARSEGIMASSPPKIPLGVSIFSDPRPL